jgi:hypothetical protein
MSMNLQSCVICHQPLPQNSKLTTASVPSEEAAQNGWTGHKNADGAVMVGMCLQYQIDRSRSRTIRELNGASMASYGYKSAEES